MSADAKNGWIVVGVVLSLVAIVFFGPGMWALVVLVALIAVAVAGGIWLFNAIAGPKPVQRSPAPIADDDDDDEVIDVEVRVVDPDAGVQFQQARQALEIEWRRLQSDKEILEADRRAFYAEKSAFEETKHRRSGESPTDAAHNPTQLVPAQTGGAPHHEPTPNKVGTIIGFALVGAILIALFGILQVYRSDRLDGDDDAPHRNEQNDPSIPIEKSQEITAETAVADKQAPNSGQQPAPRSSSTVAPERRDPLKIVDTTQKPPSPGDDAKAQKLVEKGVRAADSGAYDVAVNDLSVAIRLSPKHTMAHCYRGFVYTKIGDLQKAEADISVALNLDPKGANPIFFMGYLRLRERRFDEAILWFGRAIRINPDFVEAYLFRSEAYDALGDVKRAKADLSRVRQMDARRNAK